MESIFTKIIKDEIPSYRIYEDELTVALIPPSPLGKVHVLVIPKKQVENFYDLPDEDYVAMMRTVKKVSKHVSTVVDSKKVGLRVEGLDIPHAHVHILAFDTDEEFRRVDDMNNPIGPDALAEIARKLAL